MQHKCMLLYLSPCYGQFTSTMRNCSLLGGEVANIPLQWMVFTHQVEATFNAYSIYMQDRISYNSFCHSDMILKQYIKMYLSYQLYPFGSLLNLINIWNWINIDIPVVVTLNYSHVAVVPTMISYFKIEGAKATCSLSCMLFVDNYFVLPLYLHIKELISDNDTFGKGQGVLCEMTQKTPLKLCSPGQFQCMTQECILDYHVCDGITDCKDSKDSTLGNDEANCGHICQMTGGETKEASECQSRV